MDTSFTLTRAQARDLDRRAVEEFGMPGVCLMENAGRGAADLLARLNPDRLPTVILCGPGNNGGDGFVIARHLDNRGWPVTVWLLRPESGRSFGFARAAAAVDRKLTPDCAVNAEVWAHARSLRSNDPPGEAWKEALVADVPAAGWVVDALFGTGLTRPLEAPFDELIPFLNASGKPVLAVDLPTGLDCDTGAPLGPTVRAAHTATFVAPKRGFLAPGAAGWVGEVHVIDIGAPRVLVEGYRLAKEAGGLLQW
ncbi:MAG TPA: NAD(P)H-hydrate epimerase [Urbifossiella sp.]|jgi:NAD(P)H-hydrate epimerase|nr:NAD(P)H-hydrate epimerase [Urbifossiella sp.]